MADTHTKEQRRKNMRAIQSRNTKPEIALRSALHKMGYRFRLHRRDLPGKPDIVLPKYNTIIDVRGCFWHRHPGCSRCTTPGTNTDYWTEKFKRNVQRDQENQHQLENMGWNVVVVWECEIKTLDEILKKLRNELKK